MFRVFYLVHTFAAKVGAKTKPETSEHKATTPAEAIAMSTAAFMTTASMQAGRGESIMSNLLRPGEATKTMKNNVLSYKDKISITSPNISMEWS